MTDVATSEPAAAPVFVHKTLVYRLCRGAVWLYLHLRHRMRAEGLEHLPAEGGALLVANHQSFLDIPLIAASTRRHVCFVARRSLAETAWLGFVMRQCGAVLIDRGSADRAALREIGEHLERGDLVAMFPEGTRTRDGSVGEFKGGVLLAARKAGVPVIPAGIRGSFAVWPRSRRAPGPGRMAVRYAPGLDAKAPEALETLRERILAAVGDGSFQGAAGR